MSKKCKQCKISKPLTQFSRSLHTTKSGEQREYWRPYCSKCYRERYMAANKKKETERRAAVNKIKDVPCADCGGKFPPCAMDFDHRDKSTKSFNVAQRIRGSVDTLMIEVAKCDIVCANCHRIRTFGGGDAS